MSKKIYVGNLSFDATEEQVKKLFSEFGEVESVAMINDRSSGRFRGFCFIEMEEAAANAAIKALNDSDLDGRTLRVNEAQNREDRKNSPNNNRNNNRNYSRQNNKFPDSGGGNY